MAYSNIAKLIHKTDSSVSFARLEWAADTPLMAAVRQQRDTRQIQLIILLAIHSWLVEGRSSNSFSIKLIGQDIATYHGNEKTKDKLFFGETGNWVFLVSRLPLLNQADISILFVACGTCLINLLVHIVQIQVNIWRLSFFLLPYLALTLVRR